MLKTGIFFLCLFAIFTVIAVLSRENTAITLAFSSLNGLICSLMIPHAWVAVAVSASSLVGLTLAQIITEITLRMSNKRRK